MRHARGELASIGAKEASESHRRVHADSMPGKNVAGEKSVSPSPAVFLTRAASREQQ